MRIRRDTLKRIIREATGEYWADGRQATPAQPSGGGLEMLKQAVAGRNIAFSAYTAGLPEIYLTDEGTGENLLDNEDLSDAFSEATSELGVMEVLDALRTTAASLTMPRGFKLEDLY